MTATVTDVNFRAAVRADYEVRILHPDELAAVRLTHAGGTFTTDRLGRHIGTCDCGHVYGPALTSAHMAALIYDHAAESIRGAIAWKIAEAKAGAAIDAALLEGARS